MEIWDINGHNEHLNSEEWIFSQNSVDLNRLYVNQ